MQKIYQIYKSKDYSQNIAGYHLYDEFHTKAMKVLKTQDNVIEAIKASRAGMIGKQKTKIMFLSVSTVIPSNLRAKLRKANSSRQLK